MTKPPFAVFLMWFSRDCSFAQVYSFFQVAGAGLDHGNDPRSTCLGTHTKTHSVQGDYDLTGLVEGLSPREQERVLAGLRQLWHMAVSPGAATAMMRMAFEVDVRDVLPHVNAPTLCLIRSGDENVPSMKYTDDRIPDARYVELPGSAHLMAFGDQDAVLLEIERFLTGKRPIPEGDRLLTTVMFTDIVGSTDRAAELGDHRWKDLLAEHDSLARREMDLYRGVEIVITGDGFLATFDGPARAVRCALAISEAIHGLGIEIRAGVHTGEVELVEGDVRGIAVHVGARVAALAGPREVLVSSTVKDLVAGSGLRFEDAGEHELKGVPETWRLFRVTS